MRISEIAKFINNAKVVVDIGSDHAFLSTILIDSNKAQIVYNIEKNKDPFLNGVKNTSSLKYKNKIFNVLSDGFNKFDEKIEIDYCVISGVGGKLITKILADAKNSMKNFVLCPNNNISEVRKWAKETNLFVVQEKTILDHDIYYEIIVLSKTTGLPLKTKEDVEFGILKIKEKDTLYLSKLEKEINQKNIFLQSIKKYNQNEWDKIQEKMNYIEKIRSHHETNN